MHSIGERETVWCKPKEVVSAEPLELLVATSDGVGSMMEHWLVHEDMNAGVGL
jgi:hypothetical protein